MPTEVQFRSLDWGNTDLSYALTQQPIAAVPLEPIPLGSLLSKPASNQGELSNLERAIARSEEAARQSRVAAQQEQQRLREEEIFKREQARRDEIWRRVQKTEPPWLDPEPQYRLNKNGEYEYRPKPLGSLDAIKPSRAELPVTPSQTSQRIEPRLEPTATPRPATLKQSAPVAVLELDRPPTSLPEPAGTGRISQSSKNIGGVGTALAAVDLGNRLIQGQSLPQAAVGTTGTIAGGVIGAAVGSFAGPVGTAIGGAVGSQIGGWAADTLWNKVFPPSADKLKGDDAGFVPVTGGYEVGAYIRVDYCVVYRDGSTFRNYQNGYGRFYGTRIQQKPTSEYESVAQFYWHGSGSPQPQPYWDSVTWRFSGQIGIDAIIITNITRLDGKPEIPMPANQEIPSLPADRRIPPSTNYPGSANSSPPRAVPAAGAKAAPNNYAPGSMPGGGTQRGDGYGWMPHGGLAPGITPNPTQTPSNLGGNLPTSEPVAMPPGYIGAAEKPYPAAGGNATTEGQKVKNFGDDNVVGIPIGASGTTTISRVLDNKKSEGIPDAQKLNPPSTNPLQPTVEPAPTQKQYNDLQKQVEDLGKFLAGIIPILGAIPANVANDPYFQSKNRETIQDAVCNISQPTACLGSQIQKATDSANNNGSKLDQINAALNALDLSASAALNGKLDTINSKLGDQLPGGLSGKLERLSKWLHLDRLLNLMIWATTIHNALMLSNDIGQTLLSAISNILQLFGLKNAEGEAFDLSSIISSSIENTIKSIIGADNYTELKEAWQKANRIYQATINIFNQIQGTLSTILNALEITAGRVGKIGNALKKVGEVADSAYSWMNPQPKFNRIINSLSALQNGASTIQMVTQAPLDVINSVTELTNAGTELTNALKEDNKSENKGTEDKEPDQLKAVQTASKLASAGQEMIDSDLDTDED